MKLEQFWEKNAPEVAKNEKYTSWPFGNSPEMADELLDCVVNGQKRGTSSYHALFEAEVEEMPKANEYSIILDGKDEPQAIIKTVHVSIFPYKEATELHGFLEGEGDQTLAYWRSVHAPFFQESAQIINQEFSEDDLIVYEYFELVYPKK